MQVMLQPRRRGGSMCKMRSFLLLTCLAIMVKKSASMTMKTGNYSRTFKSAYMQLTPNEERVPLQLKIGFALNTSATYWDAIFIKLPQFTTSNCDGTAGSDIALGGVALYPSLYFIAEWQEGTFDHTEGPYANSTLVLYFKELMSTNATKPGKYEVTILASNGIKAYCGYKENWESLAITTNTTGFGANTTYVVPMKVDQLGPGCSDVLRFCSGHGECNYCFKRCTCEPGWGSPDDNIADYASIDCSTRVCPSGLAWAALPLGNMSVHGQWTECSNNGVCDRAKGTCKCFPGFSGDHCQRRRCPNDCSKKGRCMTMQELAMTDEALPLSNSTRYGSVDKRNTTAWDYESLQGCVCDSGWDVGLGAGQTQEPEYFGPDCSLRHCPSGDDPDTDEDETDCSGKLAAGGKGYGAPGNRCHVDCSNRGICNYRTGKCSCFEDYYGDNCSKKRVIKYLSYAIPIKR